MSEVPTIDRRPELNPAEHDAIHFAHSRAQREGKPMAVYVSPPRPTDEERQIRFWPARTLHRVRFNVWYVRPAHDTPPEGAELVQIQC